MAQLLLLRYPTKSIIHAQMSPFSPVNSGFNSPVDHLSSEGSFTVSGLCVGGAGESYSLSLALEQTPPLSPAPQTVTHQRSAAGGL